MPEMKKVMTYKAEVRLGGNVLNSIPRVGLTDREIRVLRRIHGDDGVVNVVEDREIEINPQVELYELAVKYSKSLNPAPGVKLVADVLRVDMDGFDRWNTEREELLEMEREESFQRRQAEIAEHNRIRDAAEATARAHLLQRAAGMQPTTA